MGMTPTTYTVHNLAVELGRDVRLVQRALAGVPPDELVGKRRRWRLVTALSALEAHGAIKGARSNGSRGNGSALDQVLDALERAAFDLQSALDELAAEPNIRKRRDRAKTVGPLLVALGEALDASGEVLSPHMRELTRPYRDQLRATAAGAVLSTLKSTLNLRLRVDGPTD
jgi:hypothetical protein